jgi:glutamine cyclotransferase
VDLETGRVLQGRPIPAMYFAEGLAAVGDRLVQLTWKENALALHDTVTCTVREGRRTRGTRRADCARRGGNREPTSGLPA